MNTMRHLPIVGALILISLVFITCGDSKDPVTSANHAPTVPAIDTSSGSPSDGATDVALTAVMKWVCTDADNDTITYTVYFGESATPPVVSNSQTSNSYDPDTLEYSTTYYWKIDARDAGGATSSSAVWEFTTLNEPAAETVGAPNEPDGPATGIENEDLTYSASGAVSSDGHDLEYRFDWGDGTFSNWTTTSIQNSWASAGSYEIKAQARCISHPSIISDWSAATTVTITVYAAETISTPDIPSGPDGGETNQSFGYDLSGAVSSEGHRVEYYVDWGDGDYHFWSISTYVVHVYDTPGTYDIQVRARCENHHLILSDWVTKTIIITEAAAETVSPPDAPTAPATGETGENLVVTNTGGSVSSDGHSIEYRIDFGDGDTTIWISPLTTIQHSWSTAGTYEIKVQGRCQTHTDIESAWSTATSITITEPPEVIPSPPLTINGVTDGAINESYEYQTFHSLQTNLGDVIEGRFEWGDGTFSDWIGASPFLASHMWTTPGTYIVKYEARCSVHNDISASPESLVVNITETAVETVSKPPYTSLQSHQRYPEVNIAVTYYVYGGTSSLGHDIEVMVDWGDGTQSDWVPHASGVSKTWTAAGTYPMTRQARCATHPEIVSEWSDPIDIYARDPETISAPDAPPGPTSGGLYEYLYFTATGAASSWGHSTYIEYRFDWGDGSALTDWSSTDTTQRHRYSALGDYEVKTQARCVFPGHTAPESEWSLPTTVSILEEITVNYGPSGPLNGGINESYTFVATYGGSSSAGHALEFHFDFGDGTISDWSAADSAAHTYTSAGIYAVAFQARCAEHISAVSDWSSTHEIDITDAPEAVSAPDEPSHTVTGLVTVGKEIWLGVGGSVNNHGHALEYQYDFGDGTVGPWTAASYTFGEPRLNTQYTYNSVGTYDVVCKARCAVHTEIESPSSVAHTINVYENIEIPPPPTGPATGTVGANLTFTTVGTTSSEGHTLEYSFEYRIGSYSVVHTSDWSTSLSDDHVFTQTGSYRVRVHVRCTTDTIVDTWSGFFDFTITE